MRKRIACRALSVLLSIGIATSIMSGCGSETVQDSASNTESVEKASADISETEATIDLEQAKKAEEEAKQAEEEAKKAEEESKKAEEEAKKAQEQAKTEEERLKAEAEAKKAEEERLKAEAEAKKAEEEAKKAEEERLKAEVDAKKAEEDAKKAEEEKQKKAEEEEARKKAEEEKIQKNSYAMMYYLAITAENIRTSKDNRLMLDDIYTSLLNDINPGAIDEISQDHLKNLRDIIKKYMSISTKRERLQFIYNQNKAAAMRNAVPNPIAVLSMANSLDWKRLAVSAVYTVVDSYNSYKKASESADTEFLMSGWDLDDEELENVQKNRERAFDYMVDMVQEYHLDGMKTLSENDIETFSKICAIEEPAEKIQRLVSKRSTYELLGNYWLELADCYFETNKYTECLECVKNYNDLYTGIYKKDANYVQILPKAIVAAQNTYTGDKYITEISSYADAIVNNTSTEDWSTRYFAAQVYLDLYSKTNKQDYMDSAYQIALDNVTVLLQGQRDLNNTYLSDVKTETAQEPDYKYMSEKDKKAAEKEFKKEKDRVKKYNDALKKARKTELPSLYEPLVLNCELLFALADKKNINKTERNDIEAILKSHDRGIFIVAPVNDAYAFTKGTEKILLDLSKDKIVIPVSLLSAESTIEIVVNDKGNETIIDDCKISSVERKGKSVGDFYANISSKKWDKIKWTADSKLTLKITYGDAYDKVLEQKYKVTEYEDHWYGDKVVFGEG